MRELSHPLSFHLPVERPQFDKPSEFDLTSIEQACLSRDEKLQLTLELSGTFNTRANFVGVGIPLGLVVKGSEAPSFEGTLNGWHLTLLHCNERGFNRNLSSEKATLIFEPHEIRLVDASRRQSVTTVIFFTSALDRNSIAWDSVWGFRTRDVEVVQRLSREHIADKDQIWQATTLTIDGATGLFGHVDSAIAGIDRCQALIVETDIVDTRNFALGFSRFIGLMAGTEIIPIGCKKFGEQGHLNAASYWDVFQRDFERLGTVPSRPLLPMSVTDRGSRNIGKTLSSLWKAYTERNSLFEFDVLIWYLVESLYLPLDLMVHPLATALDLLTNAWFDSGLSPSDGKLVDDETYKATMAPIMDTIGERLGGLTNKDRILNKIRNANDLGHGGRQRAFFEEIGLPLTSKEKELLMFRNKTVHGMRREMTSQEKFLLAGGYHSLFGRALLNLLGYAGSYRDYSSYDYPFRKIDEPLGIDVLKDA